MIVSQLRVFIIGLLICLTASGAEYPVKVSSLNPRILVDQNNAPFLLVGDSPHSLIVNLSEADAASYLADRRTNGFNSLWVELLCVPYTGGRADGSMLDGTLPFTGTIPGTSSYDLTTPNEAYFSHVDRIINMAATNGIQVMLDPIDTAGLLQTALDNGASKCRAYGQYLGNRYKNFPNLIWLNGNDFQNWGTAADDAVFTAVAQGIKDNDPNHLQTVELNYYASSSLDDPNWVPLVGLNLAYTYYPTYAEVLYAYQQSTNIPVFMGEAYYELEVNDAGLGESGTPGILRRQEYWTMLSGAAGQMYGNDYVWQFKSGWLANLDTAGVTQLNSMTKLFSSRAWYNLVPDVNHTVVTSGYGTFENNSGTIGADTYLTAASTPDGTLAIAYMPTVRTITANLAKFSSKVSARWYDPASGAYTPITGSPFSNTGTQNFAPPGNNSAGDTDWALVLEAVASPLQILTGSLPSATVGVTYSDQILATGGSPPYSWSMTSNSPALPPSLSFSTQGLLSGLPTMGGIFTLMVQVVDSTNASATQNFAILITTPDTNAPTAPSGLVVGVVGSSQINLNWVASTDNVGVTGYWVERSSGAGSTAFTQIASVTGTNYADNSLSAGTVYNYRVRATDAAGNVSGYSGVASATTSNTPPATGLAAAYGMNEGSGTTVTDASGNGDTGTLNGATWTTSGKYGKALSFNGTSSYVNLGNPATLKLTGSMTLEAWVLATGNPADDGQIIAKSDSYSPLVGWQFKTTPDTGKRTFGIGVSANGSSITQRYSKTVLALNTWYHVAGVYNASAQTLDIYVNGVLDDGVLSGTVPGVQFDPNTSVTLGKRSGGFYFKGTIDEVRVYNRALTQAQIQSDMNSAVGSSSIPDTTPTPDTNAPSAPLGLTVGVVGSNQINLNWMASTDNVGVTGYFVERSSGVNSIVFTQIASVTGTNYADTGLSVGTAYNYRVRATDAAGNMSSYSGVASATTQSPDTNSPSVPSGLVVGVVSSSQINLNWVASTDNVGVTGYWVERSSGAGSTAFAQIASVTGTNYADNSLSAGTVYNYRVRATDAAGNVSGYSGVASATTSNTPPATGLAAAYGMNEGSGTTVTDASGNGDTGTLNGATWTTSGKYGKALSFNGTSSYVNLGNPATLKLTGSMTLEAWVLATGNPADDGQIIAKSDSYSPLVGWQFKTTPDTGKRTFGIGVSANGSSITQRYSKTVLALNTWYHVAGVYNASAQTLDIYVNGVLDDGVLSGTVPGVQFDPNTSVTHGQAQRRILFQGND